MSASVKQPFLITFSLNILLICAYAMFFVACYNAVSYYLPKERGSYRDQRHCAKYLFLLITL